MRQHDSAVDAMTYKLDHKNKAIIILNSPVHDFLGWQEKKKQVLHTQDEYLGRWFS